MKTLRNKRKKHCFVVLAILQGEKPLSTKNPVFSRVFGFVVLT